MAEEEQEEPAPNSALPSAGVVKKGQLESRYYSVISQTTADGRIIVDGEIEIFPGKECPGFASPGTQAYEAKDRRTSGEQIALLCDHGAMPRVTMIGSYKALKSPHILKLIGAGIVNWAPENRQKFAFIFEKPTGKRIQASPEEKPVKMSGERLITVVIQPIVDVLADLRNMDIVHGAINLENMFLSGAEGGETVLLGECLSAAPSSRQHPLYEIMPRAMTQPSGRGAGSIKDDLYALGMCVAMMVRGESFLAGKTPQQIIHEKTEHGSYGSIIGQERIAGGLSEFLRGVLNDDEDQRWDIDDVTLWLEGRRLGPKQSRVVLKAVRPFIFQEQKYWDLRSLAAAFADNVEAAAGELEKDQFALWLKRNFDDKGLKNRLDRVWEKEKGVSRERLLACVCMALDPWGPLRFKGVSSFPAGFGTALAEAVVKGGDIQVFGDMILQQLFSAYISQIFDETPDAAGLMSLFEKCRSALAQKMPGYGMERVLYMLNGEVACLSPALKSFYVLSPGGLLLALEALSRQPDKPSALLDRHMVAFISVREPKMIDAYLGYVNSRDAGTRMLGIIRTLASIQRRFSVGPVPGVMNWLISLTPPLVDRLNDRDLRQDMTKQVGRMTDSGNLSALLDLVDDAPLIQDDVHRFGMAQNEYKRLVLEKGEIEMYLRKRKNFGKSTGRQAAMLVSCGLSLIIIVGYVMLHFTKGWF